MLRSKCERLRGREPGPPEVFAAEALSGFAVVPIYAESAGSSDIARKRTRSNWIASIQGT